MSRRTVRLAVAQVAGEGADVTANLKTVRALAQGIQKRADILLLPELFVVGYDLPHARRMAVSSHASDPLMQQLASISRESGVALVVGFPEKIPRSSEMYNAAAVFDADGTLAAVYRKTHLWGDAERCFAVPCPAEVATMPQGEHVLPTSPSAFLPLFRLPATGLDCTFGCLICYDIEFPEPARMLAGRGADVLLVPTASTGPSRVLAHVLVPARAFENHVAVAYCNYPAAKAPAYPDGEDSETAVPVVSFIRLPDRAVPVRELGPSGGDEADNGGMDAAAAASSLAYGAAASEGPLGFSGQSVVYRGDGTMADAAQATEAVLVCEIDLDSPSLHDQIRRNPYLEDRQLWMYPALENAQ